MVHYSAYYVPSSNIHRQTGLATVDEHDGKGIYFSSGGVRVCGGWRGYGVGR